MRTTKIEIHGKEYLLCLSTRVIQNIEERGETIGSELQKVMNGSVKETFWLTHQMLAAGHKYAQYEGLENPEPPTLDYLLDTIGPDEYKGLYSVIGQAVKNGSQATVEVEPSKKDDGATQAE